MQKSCIQMDAQFRQKLTAAYGTHNNLQLDSVYS